ncbi:MAG: lipopolysaccharide biosynthesis protein [Muribaculaceae bacterium]|nr:lipopolysaccharide biosynthesis protein [Muribaculaceae bacterium]
MRFRTAIIWNGISQFGQSGITLLSTIILARLLTPDDFGLVGIVTIFIAISQMMVDSEMGGSLLRKKLVDKADYSTLFWYNLGISVAIYCILFFTAPLISRFYGRPELTGIIRILGTCIVIHAFRVVQFIMILRDLKFKIYALINVSGGATSLIIAILLAKNGFGYWALVWQQIIMAGMIVLLMGLYNRFIPSLLFSKKSFLYQFRFGIGLLGANTVITVANNIGANIIAKVSTLQFTGYFTQTNRITTFFQTALGSIFNQSIFPLMAKFEKTEEVRRMYRKILLYMTAALLILTLLLEFSAPLLIRVGLGEEWLPAVPVFRILSLAIFPACLQVLCRNVMKTLGSTGRVMTADSMIALLSLLLMIGGAFVSLDMILWGIVAAQAAGAILWIYITERQLKGNDFIRKD